MEKQEPPLSKVEEQWSSLSERYAAHAQFASLSTTSTCATFAHCDKVQRILEVGCGVGKGA